MLASEGCRQSGVRGVAWGGQGTALLARHSALCHLPLAARPAVAAMERAAVLRVKRKRGGSVPVEALVLACKRPRTEQEATAAGGDGVEKNLFKLVTTVASEVKAPNTASLACWGFLRAWFPYTPSGPIGILVRRHTRSP